MVKSSFIIFSSILLFSAMACKENIKEGQNVQKKEESTKTQELDNHSPVKQLSVNVSAMYNQAEAILKFREENAPKKWAIIDVGVWKYDGMFKSGELLKPEQVEGKWIDFDQNGRYEYGHKASVQGKGRFHYDNDKGLLLLLNDDRNQKPEEYNVRLINGMMIIEGMDTYQDNNMQAKLSKMQERPN